MDPFVKTNLHFCIYASTHVVSELLTSVAGIIIPRFAVRSCSIIRVVKSKIMRRTGRIVCLEETRNVCNIFVCKISREDRLIPWETSAQMGG
jgi:hypothetical protein